LEWPICHTPRVLPALLSAILLSPLSIEVPQLADWGRCQCRNHAFTVDSGAPAELFILQSVLPGGAAPLAPPTGTLIELSAVLVCHRVLAGCHDSLSVIPQCRMAAGQDKRLKFHTRWIVPGKEAIKQEKQDRSEEGETDG
ncbi:hypothetical protein BaRGS_00023734, partial [Batillaria attramentaria]